MKNKTPLILMVIIIILAGVAIGSLNMYNELNTPYKQYNEAIDLANKGEYMSSIIIFRNLGTFKDSEAKLNEIIEHLNLIDIPSGFNKFSHDDNAEGINEKYGTNGENTLFGENAQFRKSYQNLGIVKSYSGDIEFVFNTGKLESVGWSYTNCDKAAFEDIKEYLNANLGPATEETEQTFSNGTSGYLLTWPTVSITLTAQKKSEEMYSLTLKKEYF